MTRNGGTNAGKNTPGALGSSQTTRHPGNNQWNPQGEESSNTKYAQGYGKPNNEIYNPGVPTPTVQPFLTADDIRQFSEARKQYEEGLHQLDYNLETSSANEGYEKEQISKSAVSGKVEHSEDFAARGLFRSSVRDADLFDIDATAEMRKTFLDTQLNTLKLHTESEKATAAARWGEYEGAVNAKKIENAEGVSATLPKWEVEPHMEAGPTKPKTQAPVVPKAPFHVQNDGLSPQGVSSKNGGTPYEPGSKPPARPRIGSPQKVMGKLV